MAEGLSRKRKVRCGHRSSKHTISAVYEAVEAINDLKSVMTKLEQCRITFQGKLETSTELDSEILELVDDTEVDDKIEQADTFKERIHVAIIDCKKALESKQSCQLSAASVTTPDETNSESSAVVTSSESFVTVTPTPVTNSTKGISEAPAVVTSGELQ